MVYCSYCGRKLENEDVSLTHPAIIKNEEIVKVYDDIKGLICQICMYKLNFVLRGKHEN
jgi:NMD protein affecting ribosome stability and mRNA decay